MSNAYELPGAGMSKGVAAIEASEDHLPGRLESETGGGLEVVMRRVQRRGQRGAREGRKSPGATQHQARPAGSREEAVGFLVHDTR